MELSVVASYKISDRINIAGTWVYGTGNALTLANSSFVGFYNGGSWNREFDLPYYEDRNNFRMNAYHRMDLGITFTKEKAVHTRVWAFGAYNSYNRKNPFFIILDEDYDFDPNTGTFTSDKTLTQISLFPVIPYVSYSFKF